MFSRVTTRATAQGGEDVGGHEGGLVRPDRPSAQLTGQGLGPGGVDVGDREDRAVGVGEPGDLGADAADALDDDIRPGQAPFAVVVDGSRAHGRIDATGGEGGGADLVAEGAGTTVVADGLHVLEQGAHVHPGHVRAGGARDHLAEAGEERAALGRPRRGDLAVEHDDGLRSAVGQLGEGVLERHRGGEPLGLARGGLGGRVGAVAHSAEAGTEGRVVDRDDGPQAHAVVAAGDRLLARPGFGDAVRGRVGGRDCSHGPMVAGVV